MVNFLDLPIYLPKPKVCHMEQYHCCTHRTNCRLYPVCSVILQQTVCKRDCPTCTYEGCSMAANRRVAEPVYIAGVVQGNRLSIDLEGRFLREQIEHRKVHIQKYVFYNSLFGDYRLRRNAQNRARYWADPEYARQLARESYNRRSQKRPRQIDERFMPDCRFNCDACPHPDCILPEDFLKKAYYAEFLKNHPDYFQRYREDHREERNEYNQKRYVDNRDEILEKQRSHRQKPEVKAQRREYDRKYRKSYPESAKKRKKKYNQSHPEKVRQWKRTYQEKHREEIAARKKAYYEAHRDEIRLKQNQRYAEKRAKG